MSAERETVFESVSQWTGRKVGTEMDSLPSGIRNSTIPEGKRKEQRAQLGEIALAASLAFTAIVLPNATDRLSESVRHSLRPSPIFRCEKDCTSSSADGDIYDAIRRPLERELEALFRNAKNELIESNHESSLSGELHALLLQYGAPVVSILGDFVRNRAVDAELASEALRVLGRVQDDRTETSRFRLLIEALSSPSPVLRDSAALALFDMDEPGAIPYLKEAASREEYVSLKRDYLQIVEELEAA